MEISAKVVLASIGKENGVKIVTMELEYPRVALAEFNTHRVFSRNGQSSRAVPFERMLEALRANYHSPLRWLKNQPGMVSTVAMDSAEEALADTIWGEALEDAIFHAIRLNDIRASKQYVNRLLEPWLMTKTLVTSTRWANFFKLRDHKDALPEFAHLAALMKEVYDNAEFIERSAIEPYGKWHMPYITALDWDDVRETIIEPKVQEPVGETLGLLPGLGTLITQSVARCCRLSYKTFDSDKRSSIEQDIATFKKLATDPLHASPMEHVAFPLGDARFDPAITGNFHGFAQFRKLMPNEAVEEAVF